MMSSYFPGNIFRNFYKLAKVCNKYHSFWSIGYYIDFTSYLVSYMKGRFNDENEFRLGIESSLPSKNIRSQYDSLQILYNNMKAPLLCLDFDGVIHSYKSGWKGATCIPDPPVEGAIDWIRNLLGHPVNKKGVEMRYYDFRLAIYSVRSGYLFGRRAIKKWLMKYGLTQKEIKLIDFPLIKPSLHLQIDDRALTFTGTFPTIEEMKNFRPWHKK